MGDTFALDGLTEDLRTKLWNGGLTGTESWRCEHEGKVRNVKYRRCVKVHTILSITHPVVNVVHVCQDVCVSQRHAFGQASCTAGIDKSKYRIGIIHSIRIRTTWRFQRFLIKH